MPKQKTHRGTAKRVKVTANKIKRLNAFGAHLLQKKRGSRKRRIATLSSIKGRIKSKIKRSLGV